MPNFCWKRLMKLFKVFALCGGLALVASCGSKSDENAAVQLPDHFPLASSFDLGDYKGKVVVLNFWATWCGPCRMEIPDLVKLHNAFDQDKVSVVGISTLERGSTEQIQNQLKAVAQRFNISYPIIFDNEAKLYREFGSFPGIPTTFVIDQNGKVKKTLPGVRSYKVFAEAIQGLLDQS